MRFSLTVMTIVAGLVLLVLSVPFLLVQLDLLDAAILRIVPSLIALVLAIGAAVALIGASRRRRGG